MKADPWERFEKSVPLSFFAPAAAEFENYFQRPSSVSVLSVEDIFDWLNACEYVRDEVEFGVPDHWQHPADFESRRRGDCEDHALWAWRKAVELGLDAEFVVGQSQRTDGTWGGHAWVHVHRAGDWSLLEAADKSAKGLLQSSTAEVRREYRPHFGVDSRFRRHVYWGYVIDLADSGKKARAAAV